jgi:site-specific recombinase, phage integrase family
MANKTQQKTKYPGVYKDLKSGKFFYQIELGIDKATGKRIRRKKSTDRFGNNFSTALQAHKEVTRIKREYHKADGYSHYHMKYREFMESLYIPYYRSYVEPSTFNSRFPALMLMVETFGDLKLREVSVADVDNFKIWLLTDELNGGSGYSQSYASLVFGMFRKTLDKAVERNFLEYNISKKVKAIPKGKQIVPYWTRTEFELVLQQICLDDVYEHLCFVMLYLYYTTGIRVNEGTALFWSDVSFGQHQLRIHHMLEVQSRTKFIRKEYKKTDDGKRIIELDDTTIDVLMQWREIQTQIGLGKENDFIFTYDGYLMIKSTINRIISRYAELAGIRRIQHKGLRHSHASYVLNELKASILALSKRLGHSSPEITLRHYAHLYSGADKEIAQLLTNAITIQTASETRVKFNGNQHMKKSIPPKNPPIEVYNPSKPLIYKG